MRKLLLKLIYIIFNKQPEDVNDDGEVNAKDLLIIRKKINKEKI